MKTSATLLVISLLLCACGSSAGSRDDSGQKGGPGAPVTAPASSTSAGPRATAIPAPIATSLPTSLPTSFGTTGPGEARSPELFTPVTVKDPSAENTDAFSFFVPSGWQGTGNVQWMHEWERLVNLQATVADPSTGLQIDWLPIQDFIWFDAGGFTAPIGGNYQGKAYVPPITDPAQFVASFWAPGVLANLQGLNPTRVDQVPAIAAEFIRGFGGPADAAAYRLRYDYQQQGQPWEADVAFALLFAQANGITSWYVNFAYTVRAPKGQLDQQASIVSTVVASLATTPHWEAVVRLVQQLFIQGIRQQMADTEAFGRALAQYRAETQALQDQVTQERQASEDRIAQMRGETLQGIQSYDNPVSGSTVQLPAGWGAYWVNAQGQFATSDNGFDPNTFNGGGWQRLQAHAF